jgi:PAS domain S-box-containing protein
MSDKAERHEHLEERIKEVLSQKAPTPEQTEAGGNAQLLHDLSVYHEELEFQNEELRATQIELEAIKERYADLFNHAPYGYLVFDKDHQIQLVNETLAALLGSTPAALTGLALARCIAPESQNSLYFHLRALGESGLPQTTELYLIQQSGQRIPVRVQSQPDYHSGLLYSRMAVMDITQEHAALQALKASEERYRLLIEMADDIVIVCTLNKNGDPAKIMEMNNAACYQIGYTHDELLSMPPAQLMAGNLLNDAQRKELAEKRRSIVEAKLRTRTGEVLEVEIHASRFDWRDQSMLLLVARDISQRLQMEKERRELEQRQLEMQKWQSLGALAGGIAHDFNNLLTAINSELEAVRIHAPNNSPIAHNIQRAQEAVQRGTDLTLQMVAYTGRTSLSMGAIDANQVVQQSVDLIRSCHPETTRFTLTLAPGAPRIHADAGQIQQVIISLLTNAVEAIGSGPGLIAVSTYTQRLDATMLKRSRVEPIPPEGDYLSIEVKDNGAGMDQETLRRLFEPFFSTRFAGRGLGMAAVHGIVRSHHGAIFVDSQVNGGTTICLLVPLSNVEQATVLAANPAATSNPATTPLMDPAKPGSVLIIDDEETLREACADILTAFGYQTHMAASGEEAIRIVGKIGAELDCVLLDLTMPGMNGFEAFTAMRRLQPALKVIVTSGHDAEDVLKKFPSASIAGYLQKPYSMRHLHEELQRIIHG